MHYLRTITPTDRQTAKRIPHEHWEAFMLPGGEIFVDKRTALNPDGTRGQRIKGGMLTPYMYNNKTLVVSANYCGISERIPVEAVHTKLFPGVDFITVAKRAYCHEQRAGYIVPRVIGVAKPRVFKSVSALHRPQNAYQGLHKEMQGITSVIPKGASRDTK